MDNGMKKCAEISLRLIAVIGVVVFLMLTFYSWRYTMEVSFYSEELADARDTVWRSVLLFLLAVELVFRLGTLEKYLTAKRVHILAGLAAVAAVAIGFRLMAGAHCETGTDQLHVYMMAEDIARGDGTRFLTGDDYFYCSPHQLGLAGVYAFLMRVTGVYKEDLLRGVHALFLGLTVYMGFWIVRELCDDRRAEILYLLGMLSFLPMYLYVLFVYGETIGTCGAFCAVWAFLKINWYPAEKEGSEGREERKGKNPQVLYWVLLLVSMAFLYVARKGLMVVGIAMVILQILLLLQRKGKLRVLALVGILALALGSQSLLIHMSEKRIGADFGRGLSMVSWLAMAMQEHENPGLPPGYYNGYHVKVYREAGYDTDAATAVSKEYIRERLAYWRHNPKEMFRFYKGKLLGQWNEPTYLAFIMTNIMEEPEEWVQELYWGDVRRDWGKYLNAFQAVVYLLVLGSFCRLLSGKKKPEEYLLGLILLGGFFFSIIWETKSRYIYPYSVMAIPCAAMSLVYFYDRIPKLLGELVQVGEEDSCHNIAV